MNHEQFMEWLSYADMVKSNILLQASRIEDVITD